MNYEGHNLNYEKITKLVFIGSKLLISPLEAMYGLLIFIFCKDLDATPLQITLLLASKPLVALLAFYSNIFIKGNPKRLKTLIVSSKIVGLLPCLFFPFVDNVWFFLLSFAVFGMTTRAMIPAWSEIFKINLPHEKRSRVFSHGSITFYLVSSVVPLLIAPWLDLNPHVWKWVFFFLAALQFVNIALIFSLKIKSYDLSPDIYHPYDLKSIGSVLIGPWKNCWTLMFHRPDFRHYQCVFMLGGAGLMVMQPALPIYFKETLQLTYTELTLAKFLCMSLAFTLASPIWASWLNRIPIHLFNSYVTLLAGAFALFVIAADYQLVWLYIAYLTYGMMQAGSELSWNLSGPLFSKHNDSTLFTGVNVAMVGIRGTIAPFIGGFLIVQTDAVTVFLCGSALCFLGSIYSYSLYAQEKAEFKTSEISAV